MFPELAIPANAIVTEEAISVIVSVLEELDN